MSHPTGCILKKGGINGHRHVREGPWLSLFWAACQKWKMIPDVINYSSAVSAFGQRLREGRPVAAVYPLLSSMPKMRESISVRAPLGQGCHWSSRVEF